MLLPTKVKSLKDIQPKQNYDAFRENRVRFSIYVR